jgi:hypothetical protein
MHTLDLVVRILTELSRLCACADECAGAGWLT